MKLSDFTPPADPPNHFWEHKRQPKGLRDGMDRRETRCEVEKMLAYWRSPMWDALEKMARK